MTKISEESTLGVWSNENWNDKDQWKKIKLDSRQLQQQEANWAR